jgi:hypothetical protein
MSLLKIIYQKLGDTYATQIQEKDIENPQEGDGNN